MTDPFADDLDVQRRDYNKGLVPLMGIWKQTFDLRPVSHSNRGSTRAAFIQNVRERLNNKFMFSRFIEVIITLRLDTQTVMESDAYGDLDNYSKTINDALKGRDGLFIDDCQIYRLGVGFELTSHTSFDVEIRAMVSDEFVLKAGLKLYGMPNGLYYPQATAVWENGQVDQLDTFRV